MKRALTAILLVFGAFAACVMVFPSTQAPEWIVTVHDPKGIPLAGWIVTETWQDYSCESTEHVVQTQTSTNGVAHFEEVKNHRNVFECVTETLRQLQAGAHASLGRHARIDVGGVICVIDNRGYCVDWTGHPSKMTSDVIPQ